MSLPTLLLFDRSFEFSAQQSTAGACCTFIYPWPGYPIRSKNSVKHVAREARHSFVCGMCRLPLQYCVVRNIGIPEMDTETETKTEKHRHTRTHTHTDKLAGWKAGWFIATSLKGKLLVPQLRLAKILCLKHVASMLACTHLAAGVWSLVRSEEAARV